MKEGREEQLTEVLWPPARISEMDLAIEGFSATQRIFMAQGVRFLEKLWLDESFGDHDSQNRVEIFLGQTECLIWYLRSRVE